MAFPGGAVFGWIRGSKKTSADPLAAWRKACAAALDNAASADPAELRRHLDAAAPGSGDVEIEHEMLDALERIKELERTVAAGSLPIVETHHRVVGTDPCHFSAPASLPDDPGQASGRVLLTPVRAIFVGTGRTSTTAWHLVHEVLRLERDVILVRADRTPAAQFRFNTYGDAAEGAFLAKRLKTGGARRL